MIYILFTWHVTHHVPLFRDIWKTSVPAAHNGADFYCTISPTPTPAHFFVFLCTLAVPDCYALLKIMNHPPVITPGLLMAHSEPWAAVVARCRK